MLPSGTLPKIVWAKSVDVGSVGQGETLINPILYSLESLMKEAFDQLLTWSRRHGVFLFVAAFFSIVD